MDKNSQNGHKKNETAIIVGGSLSGLMAGISLAREGVHVTILEKAGEERSTGAGLQVEGGTFAQSKTEKLLKKLASDGKSSIQLWSSIESRLHEEAKADPNIDLRYRTRVESVDQDETSAWVVTENRETFQGDIVIGADGHRSLVRRHVAPHKRDATFAGYIVWIASVDEKDLPEEDRPPAYGRKVTMLDGGMDGFLFGTIIDKDIGANDLSTRRIGCAWYDNTRNDFLRQIGSVKGTVVHHSLKGADIPDDTLHELIEQGAVKWPEPWATVTIHALHTRNLIGIPIKEYIPDTLVKGRMALIGDAAHAPAPITASGFNESLQDAVVLGKCVAKGILGEEAAGALQKYESLRLHTVRRIVESGHSFSRSFGRP